MPAWRASTGRGLDRLSGEAAARDQPGDHRVRVPHLAGGQLVATPHRRRNGGNQIQYPPRDIRVVRQSLWTFYRFVDIWDSAATPAAYLVAEDPQSAHPAASDRTFCDHATLEPIAVAHRRLLDHKPPLRHTHLECRVVEVAAWPAPERSRHSLEHTAVPPHGVTAGTERQPVKINPALGGRAHSGGAKAEHRRRRARP